MKNVMLEKISQSLAQDSIIEKINAGQTLTLEELFVLKNSLEKKIQQLVLSK